MPKKNSKGPKAMVWLEGKAEVNANALSGAEAAEAEGTRGKAWACVGRESVTRRSELVCDLKCIFDSTEGSACGGVPEVRKRFREPERRSQRNRV